MRWSADDVIGRRWLEARTHLELVLDELAVEDLVGRELLERHAAGAFQRACCAGGGNVGVQG